MEMALDVTSTVHSAFLGLPFVSECSWSPAVGRQEGAGQEVAGRAARGAFAVTAAQEPAAGPAALPWAHLPSASGLGALAVPGGPSSAAGRTERSCSWVRAT